MRSTPVCALILLAACATTPKPPPEPTPGWVEVITPHLHIRAELDTPAAVEVARSMEAVRSALTSFWGPDFAPDDRLDVVIFREHASLSDFAPFTVRAFLADTHAGKWMVSSLAAYEDSSFQIVQAHELAHHLGAYAMLRQPRWLNEGLASYLETIELDRASNRVAFGKTPSWIRPEAEKVSLARLWAWEGDELAANEIHRYVAQSWRLVHHLLDARPEQFAAFRRLLGTGTEPKAAWATAFAGLTDAALEKELAADQTFETTTAPLRLEPLEPVVAPMSHAEVHAVRAVLQANTSEPLQRSQSIRKVEQHLERALALDPDNERALVVKAWLMVDDAQRLSFLRERVAKLPHSGKILEAYALNLGHAGEDPRALLTQALALEPNSGTLIVSLAWYSALAGEGDRAVEFAERAVAQRPWDPSVVAVLAGSLGAAGRCPEAAARVQQAIDLLGHSKLGRPALERQLQRYAQGCTPEHPVLPQR